MAFTILGEGELASMNHTIVLMFEKVAHRNILLGIPIQILALCNYFKNKYLNNLTCNTTHILLFLI
jgi:hypothetical protein